MRMRDERGLRGFFPDKTVKVQPLIMAASHRQKVTLTLHRPRARWRDACFCELDTERDTQCLRGNFETTMTQAVAQF
jgi:hypothetical protein